MKNSKKTGYPSIDRSHLRGIKRHELNPFIPNISISKAIDLLSFGHLRTPVIEQHNLTVTRGQYIRDAKMVSKALLQLGIREGDIVIISTPNLYQSLVMFKALNRIGAITTFLDNEATEEELIKYLKLYNSPILVTYDKDYEYAENIICNSPLRFVINIDKTKVDSREQIGEPNNNSNFIQYHNLSSIADIWNNRKVKINQMFSGKKDALILYTSGSTGNPKGMVFTNENVIAALMYLKYSTHAQPYDKENFWWLSVVPFMYPYGFVCSVLVPLLGGFGSRLAPNLSQDTLNDYLKKDSHVICGSPALLDLIFQSLDKNTKIPSLHTFLSGGDFLSAQKSCEASILFRKHGAMHANICNGFGNGEILGCASNSMGYECRPETVGKLILGPNYRIVTVDKHTKKERESKYNEPGELWVSGKHVFKEYYNKPDLTSETIRYFEGKRYYRTGTYGFLGEDRYFTLIGRASRFYINSAFKKVYCEKVQRIVSMIDGIVNCAIVPMPDKEKRFVSKAFIVLQKGIKPSEQTKNKIINELKNSSTRSEFELKDYEIPYSITFLKEIPRTAADKVDYETLKDRAAKEV